MGGATERGQWLKTALFVAFSSWFASFGPFSANYVSDMSNALIELWWIIHFYSLM